MPERPHRLFASEGAELHPQPPYVQLVRGVQHGVGAQHRPQERGAGPDRREDEDRGDQQPVDLGIGGRPERLLRGGRGFRVRRTTRLFPTRLSWNPVSLTRASFALRRHSMPTQVTHLPWHFTVCYLKNTCPFPGRPSAPRRPRGDGTGRRFISTGRGSDTFPQLRRHAIGGAARVREEWRTRPSRRDISRPRGPVPSRATEGDPVPHDARPEAASSPASSQDVDDATAEALGKLSEALETTERARGHLYSFHQLTGHADLQLDEAVELLRAAGHPEAADLVTRELIGRDVLPGRWTFQVVEEYEDGYHAAFAGVERRIRERLAGGRRHLHEARMKERRQS